MASTTLSAPTARRPLAAGDVGLFGGTVLVWSTTWLALKFQLGTVDPQVSLVWRFLIAAPLMFLVCGLAGARLVFPLRTHLRFAALGLFFYSTNFLLFYNAGHYVVSGLLSVIFSLASLTNIALAAIFLGEPLRPRVMLGALLGLSGVSLMFSHEIDGHLGLGPLIGLGLGFLGCLSFSTGNVIAARVQRDGISALSANAWGLTYGVGINLIVALVSGSAFVIAPTARSRRRASVARDSGLGAGLLDVPGAAQTRRRRPGGIYVGRRTGAGAPRLDLRGGLPLVGSRHERARARGCRKRVGAHT